jgi:hypothetical protein
MPSCRAALAFVTLLIAATATAAAQQAPAQGDSTRAQIHRMLRAFYFNLAHDDWEALAADILPAKVVAHRSALEALGVAAPSATGAPAECAGSATLLAETGAHSCHPERSEGAEAAFWQLRFAQDDTPPGCRDRHVRSSAAQSSPAGASGRMSQEPCLAEW